MTKWQRFGDGTWVNVDHVEVVRVDEHEDGGWELTAAFTSGRVHPLGRHEDRDLLIDCTDVLLRGEVGEHLRAVTDVAGETDQADEAPSVEVIDSPSPAVRRRRWWSWRPGRAGASAGEGHPDLVQPQPAG